MSVIIDANIAKITDIFTSSHFNLEDDIEKNISAILAEMKLGLKKNENSSFAMLDSHLNPFKVLNANPKKDERIIVIDLGGSNLRTCMISFDSEGIASILDLKISKIMKMKYASVTSFFDEIAKEIERFKGKSETIAFCFSYAINFLSAGKAIVLSLSKGLQVSNIENKDIGNELKQVLIKRGWLFSSHVSKEASFNSSIKSSINVFVVNDTIATLCAILNKKTCKRSSYVSFILGTGLNAAYVEPESCFKDEPSIIVLEAGAFDKIKMSNFDKDVIGETEEGDVHILEKMCSARYMGCIAKKILERLSSAGLFSSSFVSFLNEHSNLNNHLWEFFNAFISQFNAPSKNEFVIRDYKVKLSQQDTVSLNYVLSYLIRRSCNISSAIISAICIKNKKRNEKDAPISIVIEGSTILKTYNMLNLLKENLNEHLLKNHNIYYRIENCENATLLGSAIAVC